jgi:hypothetical protein
LFPTDEEDTGTTTGAPLPDRVNPSAMLHSKTGRLRSADAVRIRLTARISSTVSITTRGVLELKKILRRSNGVGIVFYISNEVRDPCPLLQSRAAP